MGDYDRLLRCPNDMQPLQVEDGRMSCPSGHTFPIIRGVPRFLETAHLRRGQDATAEAFGYSWTHYPRVNPYTEDQWRDWIAPLGAEDFAGKLVLEAGCGLGGWLEFCARWDARGIIGTDVSSAIDAARAHLDDRIYLVQADLHDLPFEPRTFDVVYSIGVLHHLPDPRAGFAAIARLTRPGGLVFAWVYGRENNGWLVYLVTPLRKYVLSRLPRWVTKWMVSLPAAIVLIPASRLAQRWKDMPYGDYLRWLGESPFSFVHGVVFDHLVAPTSHYVRRAEFESWFKQAGLEDITISWRNRNSWRGMGRVPQTAKRRESS